MKNSIRFILIFCLFATTANGQNIRSISPNALISLVTVEPGEELYSTFGHSAIHVFDPSQNIDRIYNYGIFDFDQPDFYLNFCRGKLLYVLDVERFRSFEKSNLADERGSSALLLELTPTQKERLFNMLEENALAENRSYKYDFFYDNCATRIRDIVRNSLYGQVEFDTTAAPTRATMRQLLKPYLVRHPWTDFGIDLVLGMPTDKIAGSENYMFLPDHLSNAFQSARVSEGQRLTGELISKPFAKEVRPPAFSIPPIYITTLFALIGLLCMFNTRADRIFNRIFWLILGIAGCIISFLWFFTEHTATKNNLNLFWALPTHLFVFWRRRREGLMESYYMIAGVLAAILIVGWKWLPQALPVAAMPIIILVVIKGFWRPKTEY